MPALGVFVAASAIILPLSFDGGNVYVPARIAGIPLRLIVDTGGKGGLQLKAEVAETVGVGMKPDVVSRIDALGNEFKGRAFEVREFAIGDTTFHDVVGFVRGEAADGPTGRLPADGLLGMEFLRPYIARFDYAEATLTLFSDGDRDEATQACNGHNVPLITHPLGFWTSEMTTDHGPFRFVWDSGATYSLIALKAARAHQLPLNDDLYQTKSFILGTTDFGPLDLVAIDLHIPEVDGLLGYNFFQDHVICFDGPRTAIKVIR